MGLEAEVPAAVRGGDWPFHPVSSFFARDAGRAVRRVEKSGRELQLDYRHQMIDSSHLRFGRQFSWLQQFPRQQPRGVWCGGDAMAG
jgi:hypothetical protein